VKSGFDLVLASASPRRRHILELLGIPFRVEAPAHEEPSSLDVNSNPVVLAMDLALAKARAVARHLSSGLVLGADTIVIDGVDVLGKPASEEEAISMLGRLKEKTHSVVTGVALIDVSTGAEAVRNKTTQVIMRAYNDKEIAAYVRSGDPFDKAGAYAIQHEEFDPVASIDGCYFNVVGLPACTVMAMMQTQGTLQPHVGDIPCRSSDCPLRWKQPVCDL
jgi:MAF protein